MSVLQSSQIGVREERRLPNLLHHLAALFLGVSVLHVVVVLVRGVVRVRAAPLVAEGDRDREAKLPRVIRVDDSTDDRRCLLLPFASGQTEDLRVPVIIEDLLELQRTAPHLGGEVRGAALAVGVDADADADRERLAGVEVQQDARGSRGTFVVATDRPGQLERHRRIEMQLECCFCLDVQQTRRTVARTDAELDLGVELLELFDIVLELVDRVPEIVDVTLEHVDVRADLRQVRRLQVLELLLEVGDPLLEGREGLVGELLVEGREATESTLHLIDLGPEGAEIFEVTLGRFGRLLAQDVDLGLRIGRRSDLPDHHIGECGHDQRDRNEHHLLHHFFFLLCLVL